MPLMMEGSTKEVNLGMYKSVLPSTGWTDQADGSMISTDNGIYRVDGGSSISPSSYINMINASGSYSNIVDSSTSTYTQSSDVTSQYGGILITLAKPMAITMIRAKINCTNSTGIRWQVSGSNDETYPAR